MCLDLQEVEMALDRLRHRGSVERLLRTLRVRQQPELTADPAYRTLFNGYYRMRQKPPQFYESFYELLRQLAERQRTLSLDQVMQHVFDRTGERHLSFCSKLLATVDDSAVIFDRNVAQRFGVPTTPLPADSWLAAAMDRYAAIRKGIVAITQCPNWRQIRELFDDRFPEARHLSDIRKADLIVWASYDDSEG